MIAVYWCTDDAELHMEEVSTQRQQVQVHMPLAVFVEGFIISKWI